MEYVDVVENKTACEMQTKIELIQYKAFTITITVFNDIKQINNAPNPLTVDVNYCSDMEIEKLYSISLSVDEKYKPESDMMDLQYNSKLIDESEFDYSFIDVNKNEEAIINTQHNNVVNDIDYNALNNYMADNIDQLGNLDAFIKEIS